MPGLSPPRPEPLRSEQWRILLREAAQKRAAGPGCAAPGTTKVERDDLVHIAYRMRALLCLVSLTVLQYGVIFPNAQFIKLSFFAAQHGGGDCEAFPTSEPCRRASADVAIYHGVSHGVTSTLACLTAMTLGSYSDNVGRRPVLRVKVAVSVLPVLALAFHVVWNGTLWLFLVLFPLYEALDVNGVFLASVSDVTSDPRTRTAAFSLLCAVFLSVLCVVMPIAGVMSPKAAIYVALVAAFAKIVFMFKVFPESASLTETAFAPPVRPRNPLAVFHLALSILRRNAFISRMVMVLVFSALSIYGFTTILPLYLTAYLGMTKQATTRLVSLSGLSIFTTVAIGLQPLVGRLGEVGALRVCLAAAVMLPACVAECVQLWQVFSLIFVLSGLVLAQVPITSAIKSNLVTKDEQGILQGVLASVHMGAAGVSQICFGLFYYLATEGGATPWRGAALPPLRLAASLALLAFLTACTLPRQPPPPGAQGRADDQESTRFCNMDHTCYSAAL